VDFSPLKYFDLDEEPFKIIVFWKSFNKLTKIYFELCLQLVNI
jgi:hypothetical protein